ESCKAEKHPAHVILEGLVACNPLPAFPEELLYHLATHLHCWHTAMAHLEGQIFAQPSKGWKSGGMLCDLYSQLQEEDYYIGVKRSRVLTTESRVGLAYMQHSQWAKAQEVFYKSMELLSSTSFAFSTVEQREEHSMWFDGWIICSKHLNQWKNLNEFLHECSNPKLELECATRLQQWDAVDRLTHTYNFNSPIIKLFRAYHALHEVRKRGEEGRLEDEGGEIGGWRRGDWRIEEGRLKKGRGGDCKRRLMKGGGGDWRGRLKEGGKRKDAEKAVQSFNMLIQPGKLNDSALQLTEGRKMLLKCWRALPSPVSACHIPLLLQFQQYVELHESHKLVMEISNAFAKPGSVPEVRGVLNSWRDRLPNKWDTMQCWNDLFVWRNFIFSVIQKIVQSRIKSVEDQKTWCAYLQDMPWTMVKFAAIARKPHKIPEVSVTLLQALEDLSDTNNEIFAAENYLALIEKVKLCLTDQTQVRTGLNIINCFNFDSFPGQNYEEYIAKLFRLKGVLLNRVNSEDISPRKLSSDEITPIETEDAGIALSTALKLYPLLSQGWISWAKFSDKLFFLKKDISYAVSAIISYLFGICLRPDKSRIFLSRVLWLLSHDHENGRPLCSAFGRFSDVLPPHLWVCWLPQLLTGLERLELPESLKILFCVLNYMPQTIYFDIRTAWGEKKDILVGMGAYSTEPTVESAPHLVSATAVPGEETAASSTPSLSPSPRNNTSALHASFMALSQLIVTIRTSFVTLCLALEHLIEELVTHGKPDAMHEILCAIRTLFGQCAELSWHHTHLPLLAQQFFESNITLRYNWHMKPPQSGGSTRSAPLSFTHTVAAGVETSRQLLLSFWEDFKKDFPLAFSESRPLQEIAGGQLPLKGASLTTPRSPHVAMPLLEAMLKLKKWKDILTRRTQMICWEMNLADMFTTLGDLIIRLRVKLEMPGQHWKYIGEAICLSGGLGMEQPVYIERIDPRITLTTRSHYTLKRLGFQASNGSTYHFVLQPYSALQQRADQRMLQFQVILNQLLYRFKETRSRAMAFILNSMVSIHPRCRLLEDTPEYRTFYETFQDMAHVSTGYLDADIPMMLHRNMLRQKVFEAYKKKMQELLKEGKPVIPPLTAHVPSPSRVALCPPEPLNSALPPLGAQRHPIPFSENERMRKVGLSQSPSLSSGQEDNEGGGPSLFSLQKERAVSCSGKQSENLSLESPSPPSLLSVSKGKKSSYLPIPAKSTRTPSSWFAHFNQECHMQAVIDVYEEICEVVSEDLLRSYVHNIHPDADHSFVFIKQFTTNYGMLSIMNYLFSMVDLNPMKLLFAPDTGQLIQLEFKPHFNVQYFLLEYTGRVPFRFTRNIEALIGPFGRLGLLPGVMFSLMECLQKNEFHLRNLLCLIFRDDLMALSQNRASLLSSAALSRRDVQQAMHRSPPHSSSSSLQEKSGMPHSYSHPKMESSTGTSSVLSSSDALLSTLPTRENNRPPPYSQAASFSIKEEGGLPSGAYANTSGGKFSSSQRSSTSLKAPEVPLTTSELREKVNDNLQRVVALIRQFENNSNVR
ncbi:non-specific serine/threonine protein kinase, partial [Cardiosporidium cionae]